jgi:hypothetical protein
VGKTIRLTGEQVAGLERHGIDVDSLKAQKSVDVERIVREELDRLGYPLPVEIARVGGPKALDRRARKILEQKNLDRFSEADYRRAVKQAIQQLLDDRKSLGAKVARLERKAGIQREEIVEASVAKKVGDDLYALGGRYFTGDELRATAEEQYEDQHLHDDAYRGLREPTRGTNVDEAARALLARRGIHEPSYDQYANALAEVTS